jgi:N-acetyl-gamma-glutamyl-phosphate reductase
VTHYNKLERAATLAERAMAKQDIRIGIFGGSGYGGSELLRILLQHPHSRIEFVTANEQAGKPVGEVHRNLNGLTDLYFSNPPADGDCAATPGERQSN